MSEGYSNQKLEVKLNKYVCWEDNCDFIPEIISIDIDSGKVNLCCNMHGKKELKIEEYNKIIQEKIKKNSFEPKIGNIDNFEINNEENMNSRNALKSAVERDASNIISNNLIIDTQEKNPCNFNINQSMKNIAESFTQEKSELIDDIINEIFSENSNKREENALKKLKEEKLINLGPFYKEKNFCLKLRFIPGTNQIPLEDNGFEFISDIRFPHLIEINLSNNKITTAKYLNKMLLPHLEIINLSDNELDDENGNESVKSIANLQSKNLREIFLQNNYIKEFEPFAASDSYFEKLEILRVDNNNRNKDYYQSNENNKKDIYNISSFKKVINKYKNKIFYKDADISSFINNYEIYIDEKDFKNLEKLDLSSKKKDESLLRELYPLINYDNKIKYLSLQDNLLEDLSLLNKMPLFKLEELDLSLNQIKNIQFLKKTALNFKKLKILCLNHNKIADISPLFKLKSESENRGKNRENNFDLIFPRLKGLSLKYNNLDIKEKKTKEFLKYLINKENENESLFSIDYNEEDIVS